MESEAITIGIKRKTRLAVHNYKNAQDDFDFLENDSDYPAQMTSAPRWTKRNRGHRGYKRQDG